MHGGVVAMVLGATISILLRWLGLGLGLGWPSSEAATTALLLLWRRLLRRTPPAPWSELPPELLGLVLSRLLSQADRVRLRAVCRPWRSAPRPQPLPWIFLRDDTFLTLPDGALHRLPRRLCFAEIVIRVSTGNTLFFSNRNGHCCLANPSSGEITPLNISLAGYSSCRIHKVVLSDHIAAFLIKDQLGFITIIPRDPRRGGRHMAWEPPVNGLDATVDIAVFQGKLYVLTRISNDAGPPQLELHLLYINDEQNDVRSVQCISATPINRVAPCSSAIGTRFYFYLVASGDRLLMVTQRIDKVVPSSLLSPLVIQFEVSEAVDLISGHGRWSKVDTLVGRALFVSRGCSESLPTQCGAREDCIYFITEQDGLHREGGLVKCIVYIKCIVYNVRDKTMEQVTWVRNNGRWHPTWLFPADI